MQLERHDALSRDTLGPAVSTAGRDRWTNLHADAAGSDEVTVALAPTFERQWVAEPSTYNVTGPVFDRSGHLYFSPLYGREELLLVSLDPVDGSRSEGQGVRVAFLEVQACIDLFTHSANVLLLFEQYTVHSGT